MTPRVAIIGCGLIGRKRANALGDAQVTVCADVALDRAEALAQTIAGGPGAHAPAVTTDWRAAVARPDVDIVIVATTNDVLADVTRAAIVAGKHVLVEKPAARNLKELDGVIETATRHRSIVRVGFNHRYHPAIQKAHALVREGVVGDLMFLRSRYGHGGRIGYEKEWRADPARSGGGELIDQGVHVIDLSRWFLGDIATVDGFADTCFWNMPVDDNAFMTLRTARGQTAFLHVSCTEWKNLFSLEIYGRVGKLQIDGLGGSYGVETLTHYRMLPEMGPPITTVWAYPEADRSWALEFSEFVQDIRDGRQPEAGLGAARAALVVVDAIYQRSQYDFAKR